MSSRIRTLEVRKEVRWQGSVEVIGDHDATLLRSEAAILSPLPERDESGYRTAGLGNDDLFPGSYTPEQSRQVRLRLMDVHGCHVSNMDLVSN